MATAPVLDSFDRAILDLLQRDNTLPQRNRRAVHLSTPAVQRRIKRLQDSGVIAANVAVVAAAKVGRPLTIIVEVRVVASSATAWRRSSAACKTTRPCSSATRSPAMAISCCCFRRRRWKIRGHYRAVVRRR